MAEVKNIQYKSRLQGISIPVEPRGFVGSIMLNAVADGFIPVTGTGQIGPTSPTGSSQLTIGPWYKRLYPATTKTFCSDW